MSETLQYKKMGKGPKTLVLLHHFGGSADTWQWVAKYLTGKFSLVLITLPGFGNTPSLSEPSIYHFAKYINNCLSDLKLKNYLLCGHAMSGKLILYADQIAKTYKANGLVLIAPQPPTAQNMADSEKQGILFEPTIDSATLTVKNSVVRPLKKKRLNNAIASQQQIDEKTREWWLNEGMKNDISNRIKGVTTPTFVICAKEDPIIEMDTVFKEVMPNLYKPRLIQLGRCGHLIPLEAPRKLARRLRRIANNVLNEAL